ISSQQEKMSLLRQMIFSEEDPQFFIQTIEKVIQNESEKNKIEIAKFNQALRDLEKEKTELNPEVREYLEKFSGREYKSREAKIKILEKKFEKQERKYNIYLEKKRAFEQYREEFE